MSKKLYYLESEEFWDEGKDGIMALASPATYVRDEDAERKVRLAEAIELNCLLETSNFYYGQACNAEERAALRYKKHRNPLLGRAAGWRELADALRAIEVADEAADEVIQIR